MNMSADEHADIILKPAGTKTNSRISLDYREVEKQNFPPLSNDRLLNNR